jgi:5-hydroxyisourate hydrolase
MPGRLTTHVLDTAHGRPAANMTIELWHFDAWVVQRSLLTTVKTNADGRPDAPLLADGVLRVGEYELVFAVGAYFAGLGVKLTTPPFFDRVHIRFGIADAESHYHVPLLTSPWSYSTYRGS